MFKKWFQRKLLTIANRWGYAVYRLEHQDFPDQLRFFIGQSPRVVIDVGANRGNTVAEYRRLLPESTIHAFEPVPEVAAALTVRFARDEMVKVHSLAVSDGDGLATFHVNNVVDTSSLLPSSESTTPPSYRHVMCTARTIPIATTSLDKFCESHGVAAIDILKLDVQGGELAAVQGAKSLLTSSRIGLIYVESFIQPFYDGQPLFGDVVAYLATCGYLLHNVYNLNFRGQTGRCSWLDAIFVPECKREMSRRLLAEDALV